MSKSDWYRIGVLAGWVKKASFTLSIKELNDDSINNMADLADKLNNLLFSNLLDKNGMAYWREFHVVSMHDTITVDGTNVYAKNGIINFYTEGIDKRYIDPIILSLKEFLLNNNVRFREFFKDRSAMYNVDVIRIPILNINQTASKTNRSLNISNNNAFFIFNKVLKYNINLWEENEFDVIELKKRIEYYEGETKLPYGDSDNIFVGLDMLKDKEFMSGEKAMSSYSQEDVRNRLRQIRELCEYAIKNGKTKLQIY